LVKSQLALAIATFVSQSRMIHRRLLLGPRGVEGLIAAPLTVITVGRDLFVAFESGAPRSPCRRWDRALPRHVGVAGFSAQGLPWAAQQSSTTFS